MEQNFTNEEIDTIKKQILITKSNYPDLFSLACGNEVLFLIEIGTCIKSDIIDYNCRLQDIYKSVIISI